MSELVLTGRQVTLLKELLACTSSWREACRIHDRFCAEPGADFEIGLAPVVIEGQVEHGVAVRLPAEVRAALEGPAPPEERAVAAEAPVPHCPPGAFAG